MMWSERHGDELYVFRNGQLIYKRWYVPGTDIMKVSRVFCKWTPDGIIHRRHG